MSDTAKLKTLVQQLKVLTSELESEIYSNTDNYTSGNVKYEDVLEYYQNPASAEEGL